VSARRCSVIDVVAIVVLAVAAVVVLAPILFSVVTSLRSPADLAGRGVLGLSDLVHEGLLEQCPGGGKVVSEREPGPRLRIVPCAEGLDLPLEEYSSLLAYADDQADTERSWRQFLHGRCVAEVRIRSDARWWSPPPRLRWGERFGPGHGIIDVSVRVGQVVDERAERWLTVAVDYASATARCAVRMRLADRLFSIELS
jgi:hypothetical protein